MNLPRAILAHVCAVFAASAVIMAGMGFVEAGFKGLVDRFAGWVGGFLIFGALSVLSLPVGLLIRSFVGRFTVHPERAAVGTGLGVSLVLIPVLHPAMMPSLSLSSHPMQLIAVHGVAGVLGGWLWFAIEQPKREVEVAQ
jgi:vacuolar-type H+-ATPase subunit I/STV1